MRDPVEPGGKGPSARDGGGLAGQDEERRLEGVLRVMDGADSLALDPSKDACMVRTGLLSFLGLALVSQGKLDQAIAHYERALTISPFDADLHVNLGLALAAQGKLEALLASYGEASSPDLDAKVRRL